MDNNDLTAVTSMNTGMSGQTLSMPEGLRKTSIG